MDNSKKQFDDLFDTDQFEIVGESGAITRPANPEALLIEAVLLFYKELGIRRTTVEHIAVHLMRRNTDAMRAAIAHVIRSRVSDGELQAILGTN